MRPVTDIHTHTIASGHAYGTVREMAAAAAETGLELLGISEHAPGIPGTCHPFYFANLSAIPRYLHGIPVIHGSEVNVLDDGTLSLEERFLSCLDYAIAGIHLNCYRDQGKKKNTENLISCMKHPKIPFVSHPDSDLMPLDYDALTDAALEYHVALEVNESSLLNPEARPGCFDNYRTMLALCRAKGVCIVTDSDAHDPSAVGRLELCAQLLEETDFPEKLVLSTSKERILSFIGLDELTFFRK